MSSGLRVKGKESSSYIYPEFVLNRRATTMSSSAVVFYSVSMMLLHLFIRSPVRLITNHLTWVIFLPVTLERYNESEASEADAEKSTVYCFTKTDELEAKKSSN